MLERVFIDILNMSLTASIVIVAVCVLRFFWKGAPKIFSYIMWAVVLFRLLCPVSFSTEFSLLAAIDSGASTDAATMEYIAYERPSASVEINAVVPSDNADGAVEETAVGISAQTLQFIAARIWMLGVAALVLYYICSLMIFRKKLKDATAVEENIYSISGNGTPFVYGLFRPRIYMPADLDEDEKRYMLLHEQTHIRRGDHIFRFLGCLALCLHWFNPLVWLAFRLSERDMEMSCDEAVLRKMGDGVKKTYSESLLSLAAGRHMARGIPIAFGENDTKIRIKNVLRYKKTGAAVIVLAVCVSIAAVVALASNPAAEVDETQETESAETNIAETEATGDVEETEGEVVVESGDDAQEDLSAYGVEYQKFTGYTDYEYLIEQTGGDIDALLDEYYTLEYSLAADISDDDGDETLEVYTGNTGDGDSGIVLLKNADGEVFYAETAHTSRAGWNNIYLGSTDGIEFIMTVHIEDRDVYGEYSYQVFRFPNDEGVLQIEGSSFSFGGDYIYDDDIFRDWIDGMSYYLEQSELLLSSQDGEIRTERTSDAEKWSYETLRR